MHAAVFLDRDNTIIHNDGDLGDPAEVRLIQGAASAIASLCGLGYKVIVVTNQGGVARGKYSEDDVERVHERIRELVQQGANGARIDRFYYCPYHPDGTVPEYAMEHPNRKPQPGMLLEAAEQMKLDLGQSWMIGDQMRDIQAGVAAGTRTILIRSDADQLTPLDASKFKGVKRETVEAGEASASPDFIARTLVEAVRIVAQQRKPEVNEDARRGEGGKRRWDAAAIAQLQQRSAEPVEESPDHLDGSDGSAERKTSGPRAKRPFRPWDAPPAEDEQDEPIGVRLRRRKAQAEAQAPKQEAQPQPQPTPEAAAVATESPALPTEVAPPEPAATAPVTPAAPAAPAAPVTEPEPEAAPAPAPARPRPDTVESADDADASPAPAASTSTNKLLRLILQELRSQRGTREDFSFLTVLAIVLQMVAGVCLLGALWMAADDLDLFFRWMGAGLLLQGATIATLLFVRR